MPTLRGLHQVVSEKEKYLCEDILEAMPPRRHRERLVANTTMEEEMRQLRARLDAMEETQRRAPETGDVSDVESENP
jgi:hypothetical protein